MRAAAAAGRSKKKRPPSASSRGRPGLFSARPPEKMKRQKMASVDDAPLPSGFNFKGSKISWCVSLKVKLQCNGRLMKSQPFWRSIFFLLLLSIIANSFSRSEKDLV